MRKSIIYKISDEDFRNLVEKSKSLCDVVKHFGLSINGSGGFHAIKNRIKSLNIDCSHIKNAIRETRSKLFAQRSKKTLENILVENSTYVNTNTLRKRLIKNGVLLNKCYVCGINSWNGKKLSLQLDHINGKRSDNRIENLRILCPNCHSQTTTYAGKKNLVHKNNDACSNCGESISRFATSGFCKRCFSICIASLDNRKIKDRPNKEQLELDIRSIGWLATGRKYGVSDNAIRKWSRKYDIQITTKKNIKNMISNPLCFDFKNGINSVSELSKKYNVSRSVARDILYKNNLLKKHDIKKYKYGAPGIIYDSIRGDYSCYAKIDNKDKFLKRGFKTPKEAIDYRNNWLSVSNGISSPS